MHCRPACQYVLRACPRGTAVMFAIALALPTLVPALSNASRLPPPASILPPLSSPVQQEGPTVGGKASPHVPEAKRSPRPAASTGADLGDAARRAQRVNGGGRVLSIRPVTDGYHVKLIKHGEVRIVIVPHH